LITHLPDQREIYYTIQGGGPDLLIVHCAAGDADVYPALVDNLSLQFRCITFDRPGYHRSTRMNRLTTVEEQTEAIAAVHCEVTDQPIWVLAHSGGCVYALAYALSCPEQVKGLVLIEPALYAIYPAHEKPPEVEGMEKIVLPLFERGEIARGRAEFYALFGWPAGGPPSDNWRFFGHEQPVITGWCPAVTELKRLTLPVLILEGEESPAVVQNIGQRLAAQLSRSTLKPLIKQGHRAPWAAPQVIAAETTAFIAECDLRR
jgi:lipase